MSPHFLVRDISETEQGFAVCLKNKREALFISKKTAALDLKVLEKYLTAIEEDEAALLPANIYTINLLKRYALYLKEDPDTIAQLFKKSRQISILPDVSRQAVIKPLLRLRSRFYQYAATLAVTGVILGYLLFKAIAITNPPEIVIYEPADDNMITSSTLVVRGKADPTADVKINGQSVSLGDDGLFNQELVLGEGVNVIKISATKRYSRERVIIRQITVSSSKTVSLNPAGGRLINAQ